MPDFAVETDPTGRGNVKNRIRFGRPRDKPNLGLCVRIDLEGFAFLVYVMAVSIAPPQSLMPNSSWLNFIDIYYI